MPSTQEFTYRARNSTNLVVTGRVQAASIDEAKKILIQNSLTPLAITLPKQVTDFIPFFNKVSFKDKVLFARQMATMINAGLSLSQALGLMIKQTQKGKFQDILSGVMSDVQDGFSFSSALAKYPDIFDTIFVNVVRSGEATGKLETVLLQLADTLEKSMKLKGKLKGALMYPSFIIVAMIGVGILVVTAVIPQLKDVFTSSGKELPNSTKSILALSDFLTHQWYILIIVVVLGVTAIRFFLSTETGQITLSKVSLRLPIIGSIVTESSMANFGGLLGMLLGSGVPMLEALKLVKESFTNRVYKDAVVDITAQVERGIPMSVPVNNNKHFPLIVGQMVAVGEQTGKMDEVMARLASYFDDAVQAKVGGISTLIEPFIILVLGVGVAYLVFAVLLPIYQLSSGT